MAYDGSCHCGAVTFTVEGEAPGEAISCNCSHCRRKGLLLTFVAPDQLEVGTGADTLETYEFNTNKIHHQFCPACGTEPFASGEGPDGKKMAAINLRCVPSIDLDGLKLQKFDGASL